jgi:hypothetical protein
MLALLFHRWRDAGLKVKKTRIAAIIVICTCSIFWCCLAIATAIVFSFDEDFQPYYKKEYDVSIKLSNNVYIIEEFESQLLDIVNEIEFDMKFAYAEYRFRRLCYCSAD